ncbi:MAG TPA: peptide ABC transporter substrate-binding protein [Candidatus Acidoferrum sp.]|nr:peptide ABC transporter substrate-binding protein [Candidatus Acidoferrum sp.]
MTELEIRGWLDDVSRGRLSRRAFVRRLVGLGLTAPLAGQMLAAAGIAYAQAPAVVTPSKRGGGGLLKVLAWDAPNLLNPILAVGLKDWNASGLFYEPLASFNPDGDMVPVLAQEVPSVQNGGVARDGMAVTWKLKRGVVWHDGKPFTAQDVVFNWEYAADPATGSPQVGIFRNVKQLEAIDTHTVKVVFTQPTPFWAVIGAIVPRHVFEPYKGARAREAPANLKPVGTGPYRIVDFKPGDLLKAELNPTYHVAGRPFFDALEVKGGGDAVSAARAVLQTGEYDYAIEVGGVEDDVLQRLETGGKGRVAIAFGGRITHVQLNQSDPWTEVDGERASVKSVHPFLTDPAVRGALALLVDRAAIQEQILGRLGQVTANFISAPARFRSGNTRWEFSIDKANQLLDAGGWKRGADGIRARDGKRLKMLFQTAINAPAQKMQAVIKQAAAKAGIEMELKAVTASSFFSSDPANADTYTHFYADLQLITYVMGAPDPERLMRCFTSGDVATKQNNWQRFNVWRWRNDEYDRLYRAAETEVDPVKRAALFIRMNDLVVQSGIVVPIALRAKAAAISNRLRGVEHNPHDIDFWNVAAWSRAT